MDRLASGPGGGLLCAIGQPADGDAGVILDLEGEFFRMALLIQIMAHHMSLQAPSQVEFADPQTMQGPLLLRGEMSTMGVAVAVGPESMPNETGDSEQNRGADAQYQEDNPERNQHEIIKWDGL